MKNKKITMSDFIREIQKAFRGVDCIISGKFAGYLMGYNFDFSELDCIDIYVREDYKFLRTCVHKRLSKV